MASALERIREFTDKNVLNLQTAKENGAKVVGEYCIYSPQEIAMAAGAIPVTLCGTKNDSIPAAEEILPRTICPLVKSSYGFMLQDSCPYLAISDVVVADTTCDGKKKMFELLAQKKSMFILQLPQTQNEDAMVYWRRECKKLKLFLEDKFDVKISEQQLRDAIKLNNRFRKALKNVLDKAQMKPSPLSGMELMEISFRFAFITDKETAITLLKELAAELDGMSVPEIKKNAPRILLTGVPTGLGSHKTIQLLEDCGASVVCIDNCSVYKKTQVIMDESKDPLTALAERYLETPCSVMSPNPNRYSRLNELTEDFKVDAVVDLTWQGCQTYEIESYSVKQFVRNKLNLPFLQLVTDYSSADTEQLKVRIEAFLEMII